MMLLRADTARQISKQGNKQSTKGVSKNLPWCEVIYSGEMEVKEGK